MVIEKPAAESGTTRWVIDADWYEKNNRSFFEMAHRGLCTKCVEKLGKKKKAEQSDVIDAIKGCCAKLPQYITAKMPVAEAIFRVLLAEGNQPMTVEEIGIQVSERRGGDNYAGSPQLITRILENDSYYGFKQVNQG